MRNTILGLAILIPLATAIVACTSGGDGVMTADTSAGTGSAATTTASSTETATQKVKAFVRTCATNVYGTLDPRGWREHSIVAGPLVFWYADQYAGQRASLER